MEENSPEVYWDYMVKNMYKQSKELYFPKRMQVNIEMNIFFFSELMNERFVMLKSGFIFHINYNMLTL